MNQILDFRRCVNELGCKCCESRDIRYSYAVSLIKCVHHEHYTFPLTEDVICSALNIIRSTQTRDANGEITDLMNDSGHIVNCLCFITVVYKYMKSVNSLLLPGEWIRFPEEAVDMLHPLRDDDLNGYYIEHFSNYTAARHLGLGLFAQEAFIVTKYERGLPDKEAKLRIEAYKEAGFVSIDLIQIKWLPDCALND